MDAQSVNFVNITIIADFGKFGSSPTEQYKTNGSLVMIIDKHVPSTYGYFENTENDVLVTTKYIFFISGSCFLPRLPVGPISVSGMYLISPRRGSLAGTLFSTAVFRLFYR